MVWTEGVRSSPATDWSERAAAAHERLVHRGHVDPVVAVSTPEGRHSAGDTTQRWEVGSVTKVLTALLLAVLADEGTVRLDDRLPAMLPSGTRLGRGLAGVSLEHLASHRSGLPRLPPGIMARSFSRRAMADPYADIDVDRLMAGLARTRVHGTPGVTRIRYSNYGMGLLGFLLGRAVGVGYERALTERVLTPLGMSRSSFDDADLHPGRYRGTQVGPWHLAALAGAGGLRAPADDLLTFLEAVRDGSGPLAEPIAETLRPRASAGRVAVGLGWFLLGDGDVLMHNGGTLGARSEVRLERHTGTAVVVLGDGRRGTPQAATRLLEPRR